MVSLKIFILSDFCYGTETLGFPGVLVVKTTPANAGDARDVDLIPGLGRSPGEGSGTLL